MKRAKWSLLLVAALLSNAQAADIEWFVPGEEWDFLFSLRSATTDSFDSIDHGEILGLYAYMSGAGWEFDITASPDNLYGLTGAISTVDSQGTIKIDFMGNPVYAAALYLWPTDTSGNFIADSVTIKLFFKPNTGHASYSAYPYIYDAGQRWRGFISDQPIDYLTVAAQGVTNSYPTIDNLTLACTSWSPFGDVNGDGFADIDDTLATLACFGGECSECKDGTVETCDPNGDGFSDIDDTLATLAAFGGDYWGPHPCP